MLTVDKEFQELIPPLSDKDYEQLKESLLREGCRDPICVWNNTIVDGHNRYAICTEYNIPYETKSVEFASRDEAKLWMIDVQLSRRNMEAIDRVLLAQRMKPLLEKIAKERRQDVHRNTLTNESKVIQLDKVALANESKVVQLDKVTLANESDEPVDEVADILARAEAKLPEKKQKIHVQEEIAKLAGCGTGTVARIEVIQKEKPELIEEIRNRRTSINESYSAIKQEKKKENINKAEQTIAEQAEEKYKPVLFIGDSIGFVPDEKYDLLLTDPPYSTDVEDISSFVSDWLYPALDNVKDTGFAYIFIGAYPEEVKAYLNAETPGHIKLCQNLIWTYKNTLGNNPKDRYKLNYQMCLFYRGINAPDLNIDLTSEQWAVQEVNAPDGRQGDRYHTWQKPMELAERFIRHSTEKDMTVFDPFACTGTFLLAATKLGRKSYGYEINPENAEIAYKRGCIRG